MRIIRYIDGYIMDHGSCALDYHLEVALYSFLLSFLHLTHSTLLMCIRTMLPAISRIHTYGMRSKSAQSMLSNPP